MRIAVIGAGPAGLLFSLLAKRRFPDWHVEVFEQNPERATYGFGVVFSEGALAFLERDQPELSRLLEAAMEHWPTQRIVHRGERVDIDGNGFSAIARLSLLGLLQGLCRQAGVAVVYGSAVHASGALGADLVVGADGANSVLRGALGAELAPSTELLTNRFAWYGTPRRFECLTLTFRETGDGCFVAHHYRYSPRMSTFIVECDAGTWERAGFGRMSDEESRACCERVFAEDLAGEPLVSNKSVWRRFPLISCRRWHSGNRVLIGDALRTVHFSIGSGTRLALEDAIALGRSLSVHGDDVAATLADFERERRPVVDKLLAAADASSRWYEGLGEKMKMGAWELAHDYMTRSGRMSDERLRQIAPQFMAGWDARRRPA